MEPSLILWLTYTPLLDHVIHSKQNGTAGATKCFKAHSKLLRQGLFDGNFQRPHFIKRRLHLKLGCKQRMFHIHDAPWVLITEFTSSRELAIGNGISLSIYLLYIFRYHYARRPILETKRSETKCEYLHRMKHFSF